MAVTVVTVTQPGVTVTATQTANASSSTLSAGAIAGIVIGTLVAGVLFIFVVLYLLNRHTRHKFTRVANPAPDRVSGPGGTPELRYQPSRSKNFPRRIQRPSISSEPLIAPESQPPLPSTSRVQSPGTPPRSDSVSPGIGDSQNTSYDLGEISQVIASGTVSHSSTPAVLNIPPVRKPDQASRSRRGDTPTYTRQTSGDAPSPSTSPKPQQNLFIYRMLKSRAQASEGVSLSHQPSLDVSQSRSTTLSSDFHADVDRLLADAERTALRDAEMAQRDEEKTLPKVQDDWEEGASTESIYSQSSAPMDHSVLLNPVSRQNSTSTLPRRNSSRRQARTPAPLTDLPPVAEVPDTPRTLESPHVSRPVSTAANTSLDGQVSHGTASRPTSSVVDPPGNFPLLTSTNFGKDSTTSGNSGSMSSTAGWTSSSSGRASRYPSLAPSSIGQSSRSGPRSDAGTDWHHPPSGLAGLTSLQIGPLRNPHSPVEKHRELPDVSHAPSAETRRARLREGTSSSIPEVERRNVVLGGIAQIDVAL